MAVKQTKTEILAELEAAKLALEAIRNAGHGEGVIDQLRVAATRSLLATVVGAAFGAFVPAAVYTLVHVDLAGESIFRPALLLVLGGLAFSAKSVYQWTRQAFACPWKALGFTLLVEGTLTFAESQTLACVALAYLVVINAAATAATLAMMASHRKE